MKKHLLMVESNTTGTGVMALSQAQAMGLAPVFLTNKPERYLHLSQTGCPITVCDTNSLAAIRQTIAAQWNADQISGITTTSEFYLDLVAQLAASYDLPGNAPDAVKRCRNKALTRLSLEKAGIQQPRFAMLHTLEETDAALARLAPPWVVKPADDTGSDGVRLCLSAKEARQHTEYLLSKQRNVRGQQTAQTVLLEEFLDAPEFSVEMFSWQHTTTCIGITEKRVTGFPYFVEQRHIFPARLSPEEQEEIQTTVHRTLQAIGMTHGASHTEIKLTSRGCAIIEINARLAGGMIPELMRSTLGIDLLEQQLRAATGTPPELNGSARGYAGIQFLLSSEEGRLLAIQGIEAARLVEGLQQVTITCPPGASVARPRSSYDRLGYVIALAPDYETLEQRLQESLNHLTIQLATEVFAEKTSGVRHDRTA